MRYSIKAAAVVAVFTVMTSAQAGVDVVKAKELATSQACLGCHSANVALVGPAYKDIAAKYQGMDPSTLAASIRSGGQGKWGPLPMPAQPGLNDEQLKLLAAWVLEGAPEH